MITLCVDTSHRYLVLGLIRDDKIIAGYSAYAWKKQSETIFVELIKMMENAGVKVEDLDRMVITKGPGSYTGIRIAMTIAKVLCTQKPVELYTISTLQLYAGKRDVSVILDARSNRAYYGRYQDGIMQEECIKNLDDIKKCKENYIGDTNLIGIEPETIDFVENFLELEDRYERVENVHALVPQYLKEESEYLK